MIDPMSILGSSGSAEAHPALFLFSKIVFRTSTSVTILLDAHKKESTPAILGAKSLDARAWELQEQKDARGQETILPVKTPAQSRGSSLDSISTKLADAI
jgi:hypothetical protein